MSTPQLGNEMCTFLQTFWSVSYCGANCFPSWWPWFSECDMLHSVSMANMGQAQKLGDTHSPNLIYLIIIIIFIILIKVTKYCLKLNKTNMSLRGNYKQRIKQKHIELICLT